MDSNTISKPFPGAAEQSSRAIIRPFSKTLSANGLELRKRRADVLQINTGLMCNQTCLHCHLQAGPHRIEMMSKKTIIDIEQFAGKSQFQVADITGGSPDMNPHLEYLIDAFSRLVPKIILRSNLTSLAQRNHHDLLTLCKTHKVVIVASLPSVSESQTNAQRGIGTFQTCIGMMRQLNEYDYGIPGTGLELNLVSNPTGAFLPAPQGQAEEKFRKDLKRKWRVEFNNLYTFANVPLGRFQDWLIQSGNFESYMKKLESSFNPCAIDGLMCRNLVSVSWDGYLFDCDFNLAKQMYFSGKKRHISEMISGEEIGISIPTGDHCYACAAGAGFT